MRKKIGILVSCFVMMSYLGVSPVLASIAREFPNVNQSLIQMLITLPSLVTLVTSLIAGKLVAFIHKRTIILASICCYMIGGLVPIVFNSNVGILLTCSGIMGIGCGAMVTVTASIICDYFDGDERNMLMGLQGAFIALGGMTFTMIGGWLSNFGWRKVYYAYFLVVVCFIIVFFTLPQGKLEKVEKGKKGVGIPAYVWFMSLVGFFFYMFQNVFNTNISLFMQETGMGTDQTSSIATVLNTLAGFLGGLTLSIVMKYLKKFTVVLALCLASAGLLLTFVGGSLPFVLIGGFLVGYAFSSYTPASTLIVSDHVSDVQRSMSIAIVSASNNIGAAISPVVMNAVSGVFAPTVHMRYLVSGVLMVVVIVVTTIKLVREKH